MKKIGLILSIGLLTTGLLSWTSHAQAYSARRLTRSVAPPVRTNPAPRAPSQATHATVAPTNSTPSGTLPPTPVRPVYTQAVVRIVAPRVDPAKAQAAREEAIRKTVEFQKKRADEGSESAQYELGVRYLKGDGVEKDEAMGRKWLTMSSKAGYSPATRKLEELDAPPPAPKPEKH